jgi:hypothetical protein
MLEIDEPSARRGSPDPDITRSLFIFVDADKCRAATTIPDVQRDRRFAELYAFGAFSGYGSIDTADICETPARP